MNLLSRTMAEVKLGERVFHFLVASDSPLQECLKALEDMHAYISKMLADSEAAKAAAASEAPVPVVEPIVEVVK